MFSFSNSTSTHDRSENQYVDVGEVSKPWIWAGCGCENLLTVAFCPITSTNGVSHGHYYVGPMYIAMRSELKMEMESLKCNKPYTVRRVKRWTNSECDRICRKYMKEIVESLYAVINLWWHRYTVFDTLLRPACLKTDRIESGEFVKP